MKVEAHVALRAEEYSDGTSYIPGTSVTVTMTAEEARDLVSNIESLARRARISSEEMEEHAAGDMVNQMRSLGRVLELPPTR